MAKRKKNVSRDTYNKEYICIFIVLAVMLVAICYYLLFGIPEAFANSGFWRMLGLFHSSFLEIWNNLTPSVQSIVQRIAAIVIFVFLGYLFLLLVSQKARRRRYLRSPLAKIDKMDGVEFEKYTRAYFEEQGYRVSLTPRSGDFGADLILKKNRRRTVVQVKRYTRNVGIEAVQQVIGAKAYYGADDMMVVTNRFFTSAAQRLAKANEVTLIDRKVLFKGKK